MNRQTLHRLMASEMREGGGLLRPERLVERASNKKHPLHDFFCWDDTRAAHLYRVDQARELIRRVEVTVTANEIELRVPYAIHDVRLGEREAGYREVATVRDERTVAMQTMERELIALAAVRSRVLTLAIALNLEDQARSALAGIGQFQEEFEQARAA